jgi:hypothetical protein
MEWKAFQELVQIMIPRSYNGSSMVEYEDEQIRYTIGEKTYVYSHQDYDENLSKYSLYVNGSTYIFNQNEIEILLEPLDPRFGLRFQDEGISVSDESISYRIQPPSPELTLAFLSSISRDEIRDYRRPVPMRFGMQRYSERENADVSLFDILIRVTRASLSLKIVSSESISIEKLKKHANAFLFNLSYNTGITFKLIFNIADLSFDRSRVARRRRLRPEEIETPKLFYNTELTEQYNLALSSSDSFIQFISYYHIMEYFFDDVYNGALISSVKEILQHPGFSSKKPKEISKIIDLVQKKTKVAREEFQGSELEALELTIKAFIPIEELRSSLSEFDPALINYYKTHEVSFSNGDTIDLNDLLNEKLPKKIAARIYKTRNSLVHSKSNNTRVKERGIYHPFTDENELTNEIPLMRIIAESIIIKSAEQN